MTMTTTHRVVAIVFGVNLRHFHYRITDLCWWQTGVDLSACDGFVPEEGGDSVDVHSVFQEAHSEGVAETMEGYVLIYLRES